MLQAVNRNDGRAAQTAGGASYRLIGGPLRGHIRRGAMSAQAWIGLAVLLVLAGAAAKYAMSNQPGVSVLRSQPVKATMGGVALNIDKLKFQLSSSMVGSGFGPDSMVVEIQHDPQGKYRFLQLRLRLGYMEKQGATQGLVATIGARDFILRAGNQAIEGLVLIPGHHNGSKQTPEGMVDEYIFPGGEVVTINQGDSSSVWLATLQTKEAEQLASYMDVNLVFNEPAATGDLTIQVLGGPEFPVSR
jgi:hypothetical protein